MAPFTWHSQYHMPHISSHIIFFPSAKIERQTKNRFHRLAYPLFPHSNSMKRKLKVLNLKLRFATQPFKRKKPRKIRILIKIFTNLNYSRASDMKLHKLVALFFFNRFDVQRIFSHLLSSSWGWFVGFNMRSATTERSNNNKKYTQIRFPLLMYKCWVKVMRRRKKKRLLWIWCVISVSFADHQQQFQQIMCKMVC